MFIFGDIKGKKKNIIVINLIVFFYMNMKYLKVVLNRYNYNI